MKTLFLIPMALMLLSCAAQKPPVVAPQKPQPPETLSINKNLVVVLLFSCEAETCPSEFQVRKVAKETGWIILSHAPNTLELSFNKHGFSLLVWEDDGKSPCVLLGPGPGSMFPRQHQR